MAQPEAGLEQLLTLLESGKYADARAIARGIKRPDAGIDAHLEATLIVPTPKLAAEAAEALAAFDRGFRWAIRSHEEDASPLELRRQRRRPVSVQRGMRLEEVRPGSWVSVLGSSNDLLNVLQSEPYQAFVDIVTGLQATGWAITLIKRLSPSKQPPKLEEPADADDKPRAVIIVNGNIYIGCRFEGEQPAEE